MGNEIEELFEDFKKNISKTEVSKELKYACEKGLLDSFRPDSDMFYNVFIEGRRKKDLIVDLLSEEDKELLETDIGYFDFYEGEKVPLDFPLESDEEIECLITEKAMYQGRDVPLNTPQKGDVKRFKVFVRDPKTGKVVKVNFGLSVTKALINDPSRRKAYDDRHGCSEGKHNDKLKPGYWSCRLPRFANAVGLGPNIDAWW